MADIDLDILDQMTNEELDVLVRILIDKGDLTEELTSDERYQQYAPDHHQYIDLIKHELSFMGGNSIANLGRRLFDEDGVSYREILCDVCEEIGAPYDEDASTENIEQQMIVYTYRQALAQAGQAGEEQFSHSFGFGGNGITEGLFSKGGTPAFQLSALLANSVAHNTTGRNLSMATNALLPIKGIGLTGLIGSILEGLWSIINLPGPAFRVTIPATRYIASMRYVYNHK